jgi:hypothetical protein
MPESNSRVCQYEPVAAAAYQDRLIVGTVSAPEVFEGTDPTFMQQRTLATNKGCKSRFMLPIEEGVVYSCPDGLAICNGINVVLFCPFFTRKQWEALHPENVIPAYYDDRVLCFWRGTSKGFRYDFRKERFITDIDLGGRTVCGTHYSPEEDKLFLLVEEGGIYYIDEWNDTDLTEPYTFTGRWNHADNPFFQLVRMDGEGTATLSIDLDGTALPDIALDGEPQWIETGHYAEEVTYTITGTASIDALYFSNEVEGLYE